jgi:hypothetical protein
VADVDIRVVIDRSAMESYAAGHIHVGELLSQLDEEGGVPFAALPAVALMEAYGRLADDGEAQGRLRYLAAHETVVVVDLDAEQCPRAGETLRFTAGDMAQAHAVWTARRNSAYYLTAEPKRTMRLIDEDRVIVVPETDAWPRGQHGEDDHH